MCRSFSEQNNGATSLDDVRKPTWAVIASITLTFNINSDHLDSGSSCKQEPMVHPGIS